LQSLDRIVVNKTMLETRLSRRWDNMMGYEPSPEHVPASERCDFAADRFWAAAPTHIWSSIQKPEAIPICGHG